jgi:hypothetical protein
LVVAVECLFCWYWVADLCAEQGFAFVLGHALERVSSPPSNSSPEGRAELDLSCWHVRARKPRAPAITNSIAISIS